MQTEESEDEGGLHIAFKMTVKEDEPLIEEVAVEEKNRNRTNQLSSTSPDDSTKETPTIGTCSERRQSKNLGSSRGRRKAKWKLKFHHQALPPEYLDHYEAAMAQEAASQKAAATAPSSVAGSDVMPSTTMPCLKSKEPCSESPKASSSSTRGSKARSGKGSRKVPSFLQDLKAYNKFTGCSDKKESSIGMDMAKLAVGTMLHARGIEGACDPVSSVLPNIPAQKSSEGCPAPLSKLTELTACDGQTVCTSTASSLSVPINSNYLRSSLCVPSVELNGKNYIHTSSIGNSDEKRSTVIMSNSSGCSVAPDQSVIDKMYNNLPYMGEITLDSKPRRGRKPKKADICHLIYKNYGTVFPKRMDFSANGTSDPAKISSPSSLSVNMATNTTKAEESKNMQTSTGYSENLVDSKTSLLEKQLLYFSKVQNNGCSSNSDNKLWDKVVNNEQKEPLNLCIRDIEAKSKSNLECNDAFIKVEPSSDIEEEVSHEPQGKFNDVPKLDILSKSKLTPLSKASSPDCSLPYSLGSPVAGGYVYWPSAGVFVHPMALQSHLLYYQKLGSPQASVPPIDPFTGFGNLGLQVSPCNNLSSTSSPILPSSACLPKAVHVDKKSIVKTLPNIAPKPPEGKVELPLKKSGVPIKRKRSAIFIPPAENPTEVSICKFKFTGGAKPSLEEKKMLSVDAGGNFRYYSGTGDKSMRGYEFFPREALQVGTSGNLDKVSVGFPNASSDVKEDMNCVPTETKSAVRFLTPQEQSVPSYGCDSSPSGSVMWKPECASSENAEIEKKPKRKRRTRKSIMREKLEQTFKEKGFLIQTQQLESAEGATYCKFRQLRKFTRYLFRSWKDYLPGNIQEISGSDTSLTPSPHGEGDTNTQVPT